MRGWECNDELREGNDVLVWVQLGIEGYCNDVNYEAANVKKKSR